MSSPLSSWKHSPKKSSKPRFEMRPLKYLAVHVARSRRFHPFDAATVTKAIWADMQYAFKRNWNQCFLAEGGPGEGKSEFCLYWGKAWVSLTGGTLHYFWDVEEIPDLEDGDFFHIDEWLFAEGPGKIKALNRLKNIWNTARAKQISSSVSTPNAPEVPFANYIATMLAQDTSAKTNIAEIRVPLPRVGLVYIGNAEVPLHRDGEFRKSYEESAKARKDTIVDKKGLKRIIPKIDLKETADDVITFAKAERMAIKTKGQAESVFKAYSLQHNVDTLGLDISDIANMVLSRLSAKSQYELFEDYSGQTADLQSAIIQRLRDMGFNEHAIEYLRLWCKYQSQDAVADKTGKQQGTISGALRPIRERGIGYAFESVYAKKLEDEGLVVFGAPGNRADPDLVQLTDEGFLPTLKKMSSLKQDWWEDESILPFISEVYSLKCYIQGRKTVSIPSSELAESEITLFNHDIPLFLIYYDMISDTLFRVRYKGQDRFTIRIKK